jgi:hypothetical protein
VTDRKAGEAWFEAWLEVSRAQAEYGAIVAEGWLGASEEFARELFVKVGDDLPARDARGLVSLAVDVGDRVFAKTFRSSRYLEAQRRLLDAMAGYHRREAAIVDGLGPGHFATRGELDETNRRISELRRELKALSQEAAAAKRRTRKRGS